MINLLAPLKKEYNLSVMDLDIFKRNYSDAILYNAYLMYCPEYISLDSLSPEKQEALVEYFKKRNLDSETCRKIIVSSPMIFYCKDFEEQLDIVYKDSEFEGIVIKDEEGKIHPYRIKNNLRSITENAFMLKEMIMFSKNDYKKVYYTKANK